MEPDEVCTICHQPKEAHVPPAIRHLYNSPGVRVDASQFARKRPGDVEAVSGQAQAPPALTGVVSMPFDPVLRLVLISKGLITPDDLDEATRQMSALTNQVMQGKPEGVSDGGTGT